MDADVVTLVIAGPVNYMRLDSYEPGFSLEPFIEPENFLNVPWFAPFYR